MENKKKAIYIFSAIAFFAVFYFLFLSAPVGFVPGSVIRIADGSTLRSVSLQLKNNQIIRSRTIFEAFVIILGREKHVISTDYYFANKIPVYEVARRISKGEHNMAPVTVTIPEGFDRTQIADAFASHLKNFDKANFLLATKNKEGYLFPDTYFFLTTDTDKDVLRSMSDNFAKKIAPLLPEINSSGKSEKDIIIMASIIEREAKGDTDREIISGILWKRIKIGMALQVDADPTTYKTRGLPKSPISNPGLEAIKASIRPKSSAYLYYLHDTEGVIHYAKTFSEHNRNILKYLRK